MYIFTYTYIYIYNIYILMCMRVAIHAHAYMSVTRLHVKKYVSATHHEDDEGEEAIPTVLGPFDIKKHALSSSRFWTSSASDGMWSSRG